MVWLNCIYIVLYLLNLGLLHVLNIELGIFYALEPKVANVLFLSQGWVYKLSVLLTLTHESILRNETSPNLISWEYSIGKIKFKFFDFGGHRIARRVWRDYCAKMDAVVYIVNARTREEFLQYREELYPLVFDMEAFADVPFLIFCIRDQMISYLSKEEMVSLLGLTNVTTGRGRVQLADANVGRPLEVFVAEQFNKWQYLEGIEWLSYQLTNN